MHHNIEVLKRRKNPSFTFRLGNLPKIFFVISMIFGMIYSIYLPVFSAPDEQYHFDKTCNLANVAVDRSVIDDKKYGQESEFNALSNGNYWQSFYLMKLKHISRSETIDERAANLSWNAYFVYLVPAFGVWVGYHIYPSLGVMETFGRLFTTLFTSITFAFLLEKLKKGRLLLFLVACSPAIFLPSHSIHYDGISFLACALLFTLSVNLFLEKREIRKKEFYQILLSSIFLFVVGKANTTLFFAFPLVATLNNIYLYNNGKMRKILEFFLQKKVFAVIGIIFFTSFLLYYAEQKGGICFAFHKAWNHLISKDAQDYSLQLFSSNGNSPWWNPPKWNYGIWSILCFVIVCVDGIQLKNKFLSILLTSVFFINMLFLFLTFANFTWAGFSDGSFEQLNAYTNISGLQGRYFTPFLLSFFFAKDILPLKIEVKSEILVKASVLIVLLTLGTTVYATFNFAYQLHWLDGM